MAGVELDKNTSERVVVRLQEYFQSELDQELAQFDAMFLLEFFAEHIGCYYYNQGLADALACVESKLEDVRQSVYELEQFPLNANETK